MVDTERGVHAVGASGAANDGAPVPARVSVAGSGGSAVSRPLVATWARWAAGSGAFALGLAAAAEGILLFTHSNRPFATLLGPLVLGAAIAAGMLVFILRAEESRLARELRTARTGTPALRALVARRRVAQPFLARFASITLGTAAVLVADGDREAALDVLVKTPALMRGGRLDSLRAVVDADLARGEGTAGGLARCVSDLLAMPPIDNREADLYRIHVLAKAVLTVGDAAAAFELARQLGDAADDDARIYATWLRVWFELDVDEDDGADKADKTAGAGAWPALSDGDVRLATLVARAHGAEDLVTKLSHRLSGIAHSQPR